MTALIAVSCAERNNRTTKDNATADELQKGLSDLIRAPTHWRVGVRTRPDSYYANIGNSEQVAVFGAPTAQEEDWHVVTAIGEELLVHCLSTGENMCLVTSVVLYPGTVSKDIHDPSNVTWLEDGLYWGISKDGAFRLTGLTFSCSAISSEPLVEKAVWIGDVASETLQQGIVLYFVEDRLVAVGNYLIINASGAARTFGQHFDDKKLLEFTGVATLFEEEDS